MRRGIFNLSIFVIYSDPLFDCNFLFTMSRSLPVLFVSVCLLAACNAATSSKNANTDSLITVKPTVETVVARDTVASPDTPAPPVSNVVLDTSDTPLAALVADTGDIVLDTIHGVPDWVMGCTDAASGSKNAFVKEVNVIAGDGQIMEIKIKGIPVYLHQDRTKGDEEKEEWFSGHGYKVHIKISHQQSFEESDSFTYEGTMEVERGGKKLSLKIWGGGAC